MNDLRPAHGPEYVERTASRIRIFTPSGMLEGSYYHAPGVRVSDSLRNAATSERYMLLTDVVMAVPGSEPSRSPFVLVSTQRADVIVPIDAET
jgi:hypothetical protein